MLILGMTTKSINKCPVLLNLYSCLLECTFRSLLDPITYNELTGLWLASYYHPCILHFKLFSQKLIERGEILRQSPWYYMIHRYILTHTHTQYTPLSLSFFWCTLPSHLNTFQLVSSLGLLCMRLALAAIGKQRGYTKVPGGDRAGKAYICLHWTDHSILQHSHYVCIVGG